MNILFGNLKKVFLHKIKSLYLLLAKESFSEKGEFVFSVKHILIFLFVLLLISSMNAQNPLNEYLEIAAKNNPELKSKYNDYLAALEVTAQISALPDPQISFAYFIQPVETRLGPQQAKISLNQMFPWFGLLGVKEDAQANKAKAKFEEFEETKSKLFYGIKSRYYDMYFIKKSVDIILQNLEILNSLKNLIQSKIETGKVSALDEIYLEIEVAELQNQQYLTEDEFQVSKIQFYNLLNTNELYNVQIPDSLNNLELSKNKKEIIEQIHMKNHSLKNIEILTESYKNQISVAKKSAFPNISLGIDYIVTDKNKNLPNSSDNGMDAIIFPKISFNIPLFSSKYSSKIKESEYHKISSDNKRTAKSNELESLFESVYKDYKDTIRKQTLYKNQLNLANNALQILRSHYETGKTDFEELLNMERKILKYSLQLEKARKDKNTSMALISYLMGN